MAEHELSEREREILRLVATGASNKEIAQQLFITQNTVKVHLRNIFAKIGVASRTEATVYAIQNGLVQLDNPPRRIEPAAAVPAPIVVPTPRIETRRALPARGWLVIAALLVLLIGIVSVATMRQAATPVLASPAPARARWQERAALPIARAGLAVAAYDNRLYAIGGESAQGIVANVERYDPTSDTWTRLSSKPTAVTDVSAAVIGGLIYVPGGRLDATYLRISDELEVYNPRQDRWETRARLPEPLCAYALATFEGKLYLFGGWNGERYVDAVYVYNPDEDAWRAQTPMPTARGYAGAAVVGNKIFVIGGYDGRAALAVNEVYFPERDPDESPWEARAQLPEGRYGMGVASISNIVYVLGGEGDTARALASLQYLQEEDRWVAFESPAAKPWVYPAVQPLGTHIYSIGGKMGDAPTGRNVSYQAIYTILVPIVP
jgi:DNA-binding CsgD family transcriptional regulator/N-acetylneuraminic acid mutarotase